MSKDMDWCRRTMIKMEDNDKDEGQGLMSKDIDWSRRTRTKTKDKD